MFELKVEQLQEYLSGVYKGSVKVSRVVPLRTMADSAELKAFGYNEQHFVEFCVDDETKRVVLGTLRPQSFGFEHFADRAAVLLMQHSTFNRLPRHLRSVDVGSFVADSERLKSLGDCCEFFLLTDYVDGEFYQSDLDKIREACELCSLDEERCVALSDYLADVHSVKKKDSYGLYVKHVRDLLGEGIFGSTDNLTAGSEHIDERFFVNLEKMAVEWRWQLKHKAHRLSQVHGNFHPWNVMFRQALDFTVSNRLGGEFGEPADDVSAMTMSYLFHSLQTSGRNLTGPFERLFLLFWRNYLNKSGDEEILTVIQPFYARQSLALASPTLHPHLSMKVRAQLLEFALRVLKAKKFDFEILESYL